MTNQGHENVELHMRTGCRTLRISQLGDPGTQISRTIPEIQETRAGAIHKINRPATD